ncbi:MAG: hypothetical protein ACON3Z_12640 [Bradymonadia bacterium]
MERHLASLALFISLSFGCASKLDTYDMPEYNDPKSAHGPPGEQTQRAPKADDTRTDPRLIRVAWESADNCDPRTITPVRIVIELDTGNHPIDELEFEGVVSGCDSDTSQFGSMITAPRVLLTCHHVSNHTGYVAVTTSSGAGDSLFFGFGPCSTGYVDSDTW